MLIKIEIDTQIFLRRGLDLFPEILIWFARLLLKIFNDGFLFSQTSGKVFDLPIEQVQFHIIALAISGELFYTNLESIILRSEDVHLLTKRLIRLLQPNLFLGQAILKIHLRLHILSD